MGQWAIKLSLNKGYIFQQMLIDLESSSELLITVNSYATSENALLIIYFKHHQSWMHREKA